MSSVRSASVLRDQDSNRDSDQNQLQRQTLSRMSATEREKSAASRRTYYDRPTNGSVVSDSALIRARTNRLLDEEEDARMRRMLRLQDDYRYVDPLTVPSIYRRDYGLTDGLLSSRWSISQAELVRQLEEERARTTELEATRARQVATIADLETEIQNLRLNGFDGAVNVRDENARLRREIVGLQDEIHELRRGIRIPHALEWTGRLEASERRIRMLEQQLLDDARRWEDERARLLARLAEAERRWLPIYTVPPPPLPRYYPVNTKERVKQPWRYHHGPNSSPLNKPNNTD